MRHFAVFLGHSFVVGMLQLGNGMQILNSCYPLLEFHESLDIKLLIFGSANFLQSYCSKATIQDISDAWMYRMCTKSLSGLKI